MKVKGLIQLGSHLMIRDRYAGINSVRVADNGQVLVGVFTDKLREYVTDWSWQQVVDALQDAMQEEYMNEYKRGYEAGKAASAQTMLQAQQEAG